MDFLCRNWTSQSPLDTLHFQSQQLVDRLDIQRRKAPLLWTDQVSHECPLAPYFPAYLKKKLSSTNLAISSNHHDTLALLNAKHISCSIRSGTLKIINHPFGHHRQIHLFDFLYQNHPTCAVHLHFEIQPGPSCGSLFLDRFSCPCLCLYL